MKKFLSINTLGALLMAGAAFTACSSEDTIITEQPVVNPTQKTVTMTVKASKDEVAGTRGLSLNGKTLNAVWKTTDEVKVYKYTSLNTPVGTLHPTSNTTGYATLTGTVTGVNEGDKLALFIGGGGVNYDFTGQKGVLYRSDDPDNSIESKYDYASAGLTGAPFYAHFLKDSEENDVLTLSTSSLSTDEKYSKNYTEATASFINDVAAIVKFTLKVKGNANKVVKASQFDISCTKPSNISLTRINSGGGTLSVVPDTPTNELYVAIACNSDDQESTYTFTAQSDDVYTVNKTLGNGRLFEPGQYYEITLNMTAAGLWDEVNLNTSAPISGSTINIDANAKVKLTGTLNSAYGIKVGAGATVMLDGATISPNTSESGVGVAGIHCLGDATIILNDGTENTVRGGENGTSHYPGIYVASGSKLTIRGTGSLTATGQNGAAGIGAGNAADCQNAGNIQIENGTIEANGGIGAAGIGGTSGGNGYSCSSITIKGGTITANGGNRAAGIGGICGDIIISGGTVTANAGQAFTDNSVASFTSAAIGSNHDQSCGNITITGGTITAVGRDALKTNDGANVTVIGASGSGTCTSVTIGAGVNSVKMTTNRSNTASTGHDAWSETDVTGKIFLRATAVSVAGTDITSLLNNNLEIANQTLIENAVKGTFTSNGIYYVDGRGWYFDLTK